MALEYYKHRAVRIYPKVQTKKFKLPENFDLHGSLGHFGKIYEIRRYRVENGVLASGALNTAIVIFDSPDPVEKVLKSSEAETKGSFWKTRMVTADCFRKSGPLDNFFATKVVPNLPFELHVRLSSFIEPPRPDQSQPANPGLEGHDPPTKRPRTESWSGTTDATPIMGNHTPSSKSRTSSTIHESSDWMRERIAQLETELESARAAYDMTTLEQSLFRATHQAEQSALREAVSQKSVAEAALSRQEAEQDRLRSGLEDALAREAALSNEMDALRGKLAIVEEKLRLAQPAIDGSAKLSERIKLLELQLREGQHQMHNLQLQHSRTERLITIERDNAEGNAKQLGSEVKQLKSDLAGYHGRLEFTQKALETAEQSLKLMEEKHSAICGQHEGTKAELEAYKLRLENDQTIKQQLKDTLTPEVYRSLGATYQTLGAFLSIPGLLPISEEGEIRPTNESS